ncbi:unnamed protein product [Acanthoscelides obtectus]|uniref:Uncharacterized protein n=1 Tax=Acanthoscelides obtectus TaxID=200917 RepID=A0A9P0JZQ6_ACAOB|nr:unnamed protein product [Acanthoscelides obtectus]CAK1669760.1 hypothetical protein AOBTE_LOCUS27232 [Acanthoscelides obtectus]
MGAASKVLVGECSDISTCPTGMADGAGGSGGKSSVSTPNWEKIVCSCRNQTNVRKDMSRRSTPYFLHIRIKVETDL